MPFDSKEYYIKNKARINLYNREYHQKFRHQILLRRQLTCTRISKFSYIHITKGPIRVELF
jgi:hypothetical protein